MSAPTVMPVRLGPHSLPGDTDRVDAHETDIRSTLERKLVDIDEQLTSMSAPPTELSNISFGKRVGDGTQMAVDRLAQVAAHQKLGTVRADVQRALVKLDEHTYGICDECGQPIAAERLAALPWAVHCIKDAARRS